jgi:hypothetical protein
MFSEGLIIKEYGDNLSWRGGKPGCILISGDWILIPRDIPKPKGNIIREMRVSKKDGKILAQVEVVRAPTTENVRDTLRKGSPKARPLYHTSNLIV